MTSIACESVARVEQSEQLARGRHVRRQDRARRRVHLHRLPVHVEGKVKGPLEQAGQRPPAGAVLEHRAAPRELGLAPRAVDDELPLQARAEDGRCHGPGELDVGANTGTHGQVRRLAAGPAQRLPQPVDESVRAEVVGASGRTPERPLGGLGGRHTE
jgi:hypothetical protein